MECKLIHHYPLENDSGVITADIFIGRVLIWHIRKEVLNDDNSTNLSGISLYYFFILQIINCFSVLKPVSRLGGFTFGRTTEGYNLTRPTWEQVLASKLGKE